MKRLTAAFSLILLSIFVFIYWVVGTNSGLQFVLRNSTVFIPAKLSYESIEGVLSDTIHLKNVNYDSDNLIITIDQAKVRLNLSYLLRDTLNIESVVLNEISVRTTSVDDTSVRKPNSTPEALQDGLKIPIMISVTDLQVAKLLLLQNDSSVSLEQIQVTDLHIGKEIKTQQLNFLWEQNIFSVKGVLPYDMQSALNFTVSYDYRLPSPKQKIIGSAALHGSLGNFTISGNLTSPDSLSFAGTIQSLIDNPAWDLTISATNFNKQNWIPSLPAQFENSNFHTTGTIDTFSIVGSGKLVSQQLQNWDYNFNLNKQRQQWVIEHLSLAATEQKRSLAFDGTINGEFSFNMDTLFDIHAQWVNVKYPDVNDPLVQSDQGKFHALGSLNNYSIESNFDLITGDQKFEDIRLTGTGTPTLLDAKTLTGKYLEGSWDGTASLDWTSNWKWKARMKANKVDLNTLFTGWNSKLTGTLTHEGEIIDDNVIIDVKTDKITGILHKRIINLSGDVHYANYILDANNISLKSDGARAIGDAHFDFNQQSNFPLQRATWSIDIDDIAAYNPDLAGNLSSKGKFAGTLEDLDIQATLKANNIKYKDYSVANVKGNVEFGHNSAKTSTANFIANKLKFGDNIIQSISLKAVGSQINHKIDVFANMPAKDSIKLNAVGHLEDMQWRGEINELLVNAKETSWSLQNIPHLLIKKNDIAVTKTCISEIKSQTDLCLEFDYVNLNNFDSKVTISKFNLNNLDTLLPEQLKSINGNLSGNLHFNFNNDSIESFSAHLKSQDGNVEKFGIGTTIKSLKYTDLTIDASTTGKNIQFLASTSILDAGYIKTNFRIPAPFSINNYQSAVIQGLVDIQLENIDIIGLIIPDLDKPQGRWQSELEISGSIGKPLLQGKSLIDVTTAQIPRAGLSLKDIKITTLAHTNRNLEITGSAISDTGNLTIDGSIDDYQSEKLIGRLSIKGNKFKILNLPESTVTVSPDLKFMLKENSINLEGQLTINQADINIYSPANRITPSPDVNIVADKPEKNLLSQLALTGDVRIILEDKIWLRGYGFEGRLKGTVLVHERPNKLTNATGVITILEGKYNAYKQDLTIESGSLTFAGNPIDNPNVMIRAVRKTSNEIVAGLTITGPAQTPNIQLFSEPPMDEAEILAYIILGYPIKQATQQDGSILANAAATIGLAEGEKLMKKIAKKFGIDEVKLQSNNTTQEASLILGKYLSPQLYLQYAYGIGKAVNTLQLQYHLTDRWMIKTESGQAQSTDILFSIEK